MIFWRELSLFHSLSVTLGWGWGHFGLHPHPTITLTGWCQQQAIVWQSLVIVLMPMTAQCWEFPTHWIKVPCGVWSELRLVWSYVVGLTRVKKPSGGWPWHWTFLYFEICWAQILIKFMNIGHSYNVLYCKEIHLSLSSTNYIICWPFERSYV